MEYITEAELAKKLREQYIKEPPENVTSDEVREMSDEDLLDMDYFLHEFDDFDDDDFDEVILSILVDTFISKISLPMQPVPEIGSISDA